MDSLIAFIMFLVGLGIAYLLGSIPSAYLLGKWIKGIDIRQHGSGNVGATNTFRVLGKWSGIIVLLLDIGKGLLATTIVADLFGGERIVARILIGVGAVIGHNWTIFLKFQGGKGIATSLGVLIGLTIAEPSIRPVLLSVIIIWFMVFLTTGYISLASLIAGISLPIFMVIFNQAFPLVLLGVVFAIFITFRHQSNIRRLLSGEESRVRLPFHS